jgi:hypothetical protein
MPSLRLYMSLLLLAATRSASAWNAPAKGLLRPVSRLLSTTTEGESKTDVKEVPFPYSMEDIVSLCKRRGIVFPSSEIYNGYSGFYDYGPLGVELKKNVKDYWWKYFVTSREDVVGLDSSIIHNPETWKSSGKCKRE